MDDSKTVPPLTSPEQTGSNTIHDDANKILSPETTVSSINLLSPSADNMEETPFDNDKVNSSFSSTTKSLAISIPGETVSDKIECHLYDSPRTRLEDVIQSKFYKIFSNSMYIILDICFFIGASMFIAGCTCFAVDSTNLFNCGSYNFLIGSILFLIGPICKIFVDIYNLINHRRYCKKLEQIRNNSSTSALLPLAAYKQREKASKLQLQLIITEYFVDFLLCIGGSTFITGSVLFMNLPSTFTKVISAEIVWMVGACAFLLSSIIQLFMKLNSIVYNSKNYMDKKFIQSIMFYIDVGSFILNIISSVLFVAGSGCFLVNYRPVEIVGHVMWSSGCLAMNIAILSSRTVWFYELLK
ncbi:hypothetical protein ABK040_006717 [Willaertia magna]